MSEPISAIGAKVQASPPMPPAKPPAPVQREQPHAAVAAEPRKPAAAASAGRAENAEIAAASQGVAAGAATEKIVAGAEQNGPAAQGKGENNPNALEDRQPLSREDAQKAVESFMEYVDKLPGEMKFTVDHDTNRQVFKIVNPVTQEVVKQFPPDEFLTMIKRLKEIGSPSKDNGIFFDEKS